MPTVARDTVVHVGTLDAADKGARGPSYEGAGLSVSCHPRQWVRIARLGGLPWWRLQRPGSVFVDAWALDADARASVLAWGVERGLAVEAQRWRLRIEDDEFGTLESLHPSLAHARAEAGVDEGDEEGDDGADITAVRALVATERLLARTHQRSGEVTDAYPLLVPVWAEDATDADGVWFDDELAPDRLSAPRGVIAASRLGRWRIERIDPEA